MKQQIVNYNGKILVADVLLEGDSGAYEVDNFVIVSPAVFYLLTNEEEKMIRDIARQIPVYDLRELIRSEMSEVLNNEMEVEIN